MPKKNKKALPLQSGQVSRFLLILAVVILVAAIIVYLVMKMAEKPARPTEPVTENQPKVVYETTMDDIRFVFVKAKDRGNILRGSESNRGNTDDLTTTERFIEVTVGGQNKGKQYIPGKAWVIGDVVDSEGRHFEPLENYSISSWLPEDDLCETLLKPEFDPIPCVKIYEVSKASVGLKIQVLAEKKTGEGTYSSDKKNMDEAFLDLVVK